MNLGLPHLPDTGTEKWKVLVRHFPEWSFYPGTKPDGRPASLCLYLNLQQHSCEPGDEMCEAGICRALLSIFWDTAHLHHLLSLLLTAPAQLCRVIHWNHSLIRGKLAQHSRVTYYSRLLATPSLQFHNRELAFQSHQSRVCCRSPRSSTAGLHEALCSGLYSAVQAPTLWLHIASGNLSQ